jgi:hypothetical protein
MTMVFGIRVTEISFDFNHEQEYILAGVENGKVSIWNIGC